MKLLLGTFLIIFMIIIGIFIYRSYKEEQRTLAKTVRHILSMGFIIIFCNMITLFTKSEAVCSFAYGIYFISSVWMLYYLFRFSLEYIGNRFEDHVKVPLMIFVLWCDCISILCNNFFGHLYYLIPTTFLGENYYELAVTPFFFFHYAIILILVTFCLVSLFYKSFTAPLFYRKKYIVIAIITIIIVGINILSFTSAIDVSITGYVVEAIAIYYFAFIYTPQNLLPPTIFKVARDMDVALYVLDLEGNELYKNAYAEQLLGSEEPLISPDNLTLENWCRRQYLWGTEESVNELSFSCGEKEFILQIQLQRMRDSHKQLQGGYFVIQNRTKEVNDLKRERWLATHDSLTGLYNKAYFCEKAEQYIKRHPAEELLVLCTDIKDFKMINDFMGSETGDKVLINFANTLKEHASNAIVLGRLSNDVFSILIAKRNFESSNFVNENPADLFEGTEQKVTFPLINYIGVYEIFERNIPVSVMCDRARMAISTIKGDYHKRIAYYDKALRDNILHEQELITELPKAIEGGDLKMYLQPQMSAEGRLLGAEALIRWIHPTKGAIMPGDFIPIFERNGLICNIDQYIWETACQLLRKWKDVGRHDLYISVNISPRDFYFLNIYQTFVDLVNKYDIDPKNIKLEITETAIVMDFKRQMELISKLRQNGFIVEMDDFGSGYSSLNMLKDLHVDILKIDMAFLKKAKDEERSKKILQMVIGLSKHLNMPVITEGVETAEQVAFLSEMGCDMFQGYYFAHPMSIKEFEATYIH